MVYLLGQEDSLKLYMSRDDWANRLHRAMDRIEDTLFDFPAQALELVYQLPDVFAVHPTEVMPLHELRAKALEATATGLIGSLEDAERQMSPLLQRAQQMSDLPEDLNGWLHAKYASMLLRLERVDEAVEVIDHGFEVLNHQTPEVVAVRAQLQMCRAFRHRLADEWTMARDIYERAYKAVKHRNEIKGGYYRRGDITKVAAFLNLISVNGFVEPDPRKQLAYLAQADIKPRRGIQSSWGFAPYYQVITTENIGRLQLAIGEDSAALVNLEFAARGYLKLEMKLEALEATLHLAKLEPAHQTVERVVRVIKNDTNLSPELLALVKRGAVERHAMLRAKLFDVIAHVREDRGLVRVAT
ncbi:MAG: hypothetical protein AAGD38_05725 [Acidobacteriota bacterium]